MAGNPLQKIGYNYNIRGWLTEMNKTANLQQGSDPKDLFAFKINYTQIEGNSAVTKALYNGNIAETFWATNSDGGKLRGYGYQYDQLNRLKNATYQTPKLVDNKNYFGENMDYDKNGNIIKLQRKFMAGTLTNPYADDMDNLGYFYKNNSNQLMKVTDTTNNPQGFKDDSNGYNDTEDDYAYDPNGNLTKDQNKKVTEITYNHLNLPKKITFGTGNTIEYIYNAIGEKLEKNIIENKVVINTKYLSGFQYKNDVLQFFPTAEGYVRNTSTNPATYVYGYVFNYTDHLGNVRLSYAQNAKKTGLEILEENNYYPFGFKHAGYNTDNLQPGYKYKYNGKEFQDELDLNLHDYGARNYDSALGRWMNIDPLAEQMRRFNPYTYALDNPVYFIDPDGMLAKPSPLEAAIMSKHVYGDKVKLIGGWKVSGVGNGLALNNNKTGFKSQVYERTVKGKTEYTYATAGTEDMKDTKQDIKQVFGKSEQYKQSVEVAGDLKTALPKDAELTFTGHSLGGGLAEANSIATADNAVTFNAAGLSVFSPGGLQKSTKTDAYILTTDPLNAVQGVSGLPTAGGAKH